jgi:GNAT superfamily N-acetyltransferase
MLGRWQMMSDLGRMVMRMADLKDEIVWRSLWIQYLTSDASVVDPDVTDRTWARLADPAQPLYAVLAFCDGSPVGLAHFVFHLSSWEINETCYLEDLFVIPTYRRRGHAQALIHFVQHEARRRNSYQVYWRTNVSNAPAIALYDRIAMRSPVRMYHVPTGQLSAALPGNGS